MIVTAVIGTAVIVTAVIGTAAIGTKQIVLMGALIQLNLKLSFLIKNLI